MLALATEWGVSMAAIQRANDLGGETDLQVGAKLALPAAKVHADSTTYWVQHIVESGETLGHIARRYGLGVDQLVAVNDLADAGLIRVGQQIILPLNTLAAYAAVDDEDTSEPSPTAAPTPAITASAATTSAEEVQPAVQPPAPPPSNVADWAQETVRLINVIRAQHNLPPYQYNDTLAQAAQAHANDCVARGWCSHTGSDGSGVKERIVRAGYVGTGYAECWAQRQTPQGAVDIWMDEVPPDDPHRRMMLHTWFVEVGVGIAEAPWGYYFIADFGRP